MVLVIMVLIVMALLFMVHYSHGDAGHGADGHGAAGQVMVLLVMVLVVMVLHGHDVAVCRATVSFCKVKVAGYIIVSIAFSLLFLNVSHGI